MYLNLINGYILSSATRMSPYMRTEFAIKHLALKMETVHFSKMSANQPHYPSWSSIIKNEYWVCY